jgi:predicted dehydrogenase
MIKTLILGLGRISYLLEQDPLRYHPCTHIGSLLSLKKHFNICGVYDTDPKKISDCLGFLGTKKTVLTSIDEISKNTFDLCVIASSSEAHFENALFAIQLGIRNLLIEKPVCTSMKDFQKLLKLKKAKKLNIWVNHERRYHPLYAQVRDWVRQEKYGKLVTIKASVLTSGQNPGNAFVLKKGSLSGPLLHDGTHAIDYIQWLLGKPTSIYSKLYKPNTVVEEQAIAILNYPKNVTVFLEAGGYRKYFQFEIDIQTTHARFILSNDGHQFFVTADSKLYSKFRSLTKMDVPEFPKKRSNPWVNLYTEIRDVILQKTDTITGHLEDSKEILAIIEKIHS